MRIEEDAFTNEEHAFTNEEDAFTNEEAAFTNGEPRVRIEAARCSPWRCYSTPTEIAVIRRTSHGQ